MTTCIFSTDFRAEFLPIGKIPEFILSDQGAMSRRSGFWPPGAPFPPRCSPSTITALPEAGFPAEARSLDRIMSGIASRPLPASNKVPAMIRTILYKALRRSPSSRRTVPLTAPVDRARFSTGDRAEEKEVKSWVPQKSRPLTIPHLGQGKMEVKRRVTSEAGYRSGSGRFSSGHLAGVVSAAS